jgi:Tol biopolymer transport system component
VKDVFTGAERRIVRNADQPDWSPDGKKLAFVRGKNIWVVDRTGGAPRRVIRNGLQPRWSPTGDRIAFVRRTRIEEDVYIARADGSAVHRVGYGDSVAWSPGGDELAVAEFRAIVRMRPDGTGRRVIHRECCGWTDIDWVP